MIRSPDRLLVGPVRCSCASSLRILREYERGVVFQLGRFWRVKGPGMVILIPGIQQMVRIDLRIVVVDVPSQDVISRDNVTAEGQRRAVLPRRRSAAGGDPGRELPRRDQPARADHACARCSASTPSTRCCRERERLNLDLQKILDSQTDAWGIKVTNVEIKHVDLNEAMIRAIARQAEAERERRAKGDPRRGRAAGRGEAGRRRRRSWRGSRRRSSCAIWRR